MSDGVDIGIRVIARSRGLFSAFDRSLFTYRDLFLSLLRRDVALRYRQTLLGPTWVLLQPLLGAGVFTFFFSSVATIPLPKGVPYFVFALVGLAVWTGFSQALTRSTASLLSNRDMVTKIYFPRYLMPLSAAASAVIDSIVVLVVAAVAALLSGVHFTGRAVLLIPIVVMLVVFALGLGGALSCILVRFRDVTYGLPVLIQGLLFVTPILYPLQSVPRHLRGIVEANPLTFYLEALRWAVFHSARPSVGMFVYANVAVVATAVVSLIIFSQLDRDLPDVI